jgi:uncharacterized protein
MRRFPSTNANRPSKQAFSAVELTRQALADRQIIQRYSNGGFRVSGVVFKGSIIVTSAASAPWSVNAMDQLTLGDFNTLIDSATGFDVCLLGCGVGMQLLPRICALL